MTKSILRRGRIWLASYIILIAPFSFVLMTAGNVPNLFSVLFFAPFYGIVALLLTFTNYLLICYGAAYGMLSTAYFSLEILRRRNMLEEQTRMTCH